MLVFNNITGVWFDENGCTKRLKKVSICSRISLLNYSSKVSDVNITFFSIFFFFFFSKSHCLISSTKNTIQSLWSQVQEIILSKESLRMVAVTFSTMSTVTSSKFLESMYLLFALLVEELTVLSGMKHETKLVFLFCSYIVIIGLIFLYVLTSSVLIVMSSMGMNPTHTNKA